MYQVGINKGIILRCTAYQISRLKNLLKQFGGVAPPTCFGLPIRPSSGGAHAVLCAVTRSDSADVCSLVICVVCSRMSLPSVCMYVLSSCPGEVWLWNLYMINPLKPKLNPICYFLALLAHHFLHVSRIRVKLLTFRRLN